MSGLAFDTFNPGSSTRFLQNYRWVKGCWKMLTEALSKSYKLFNSQWDFSPFVGRASGEQSVSLGK